MMNEPQAIAIDLDQLIVSHITPLQQAAQAEGYRFIDRLIEEYSNGTNRFDQPGEVLFGVMADQHLVGIGGLNHDHYHPDSSYGRVRHIYVLPNYRRLGIGRQLVSTLIAAAHKQNASLLIHGHEPTIRKA